MDESGRGLSKDNEIRREISHPTGMNRESSMILENCRLCARSCGVNRMKNRAGRCGQTEELVVARAALHMWEEPCISGREGSGTVFFVGCPLGCVFCQNRDIAAGSVKSGAGKKISISRLADIFNELQEAKANNINLVTPTHYVPQIVDAVRLARAEGLHIPIVYNTGSVETPETVHLLEGTVDIFLPDLKFCGQDIAYRYAHMADYFDAAAKAIRALPRQDARTIPIFAMTASTSEEDIQKSFEAGMNAYIPKPLNVRVLQASMRKLKQKES